MVTPFCLVYNILLQHTGGPDSVVGTATGYRLNGLVIESRWRLDFPHLSKPAPGLDADPSPPSSAVVMKG